VQSLAVCASRPAGARRFAINIGDLFHRLAFSVGDWGPPGGGPKSNRPARRWFRLPCAITWSQIPFVF